MMWVFHGAWVDFGWVGCPCSSSFASAPLVPGKAEDDGVFYADSSYAFSFSFSSFLFSSLSAVEKIAVVHDEDDGGSRAVD